VVEIDLGTHYRMLGVFYNTHYYREVGWDIEKHSRTLREVYNRHY
jgi:hypothetical protein